MTDQCKHHHVAFQHVNKHFSDGNPLHYLEIIGSCQDCKKPVQFLMGEHFTVRPTTIEDGTMIRLPFVCVGDDLTPKKPGFSRVEEGWTTSLPDPSKDKWTTKPK